MKQASKESKKAGDPFEEDIVLGKAFDRRLMLRLLRYALPHRGRLALGIVLILAVTGLGLVGPFLIQYAIDHPLKEAIEGRGSDLESSVRQIAMLGVVFTLVSLALVGLRFAQGYLMAAMGQSVILDLRLELFRHLERMPLAFFDANPVGRLVTRVTSDVEALNELFASGVVSFLADVMVLVGITVVLLWADLPLALVTLSVVPLLLAVTFVFRRKARQYYREQRGHLAHLNAFTQESIQGMGIIQVFRRERRNLDEYRRINGSYLTAFQKTVMAYSLYFPAVEMLGVLALVGILWVGVSRIQSGELSFGGFYLFWYFLGRFFQPIRDMAERYNVLQSAMAAAERIFKILDTPEGMPREASPPDSGAGTKGEVAFRGVWFAYKGEEYAVRDLGFTVKPGEMVAIVGATGAGKSTIIQLLGRHYDPQRGAVTIDGRDVRSFDMHALRRRMALVPQDVFLFSRSIRENIRLGDPTITDRRVEECARAVNADCFILALEGGYDHVLEERGSTLSAGERQLLAFARAIARDPEILLLDEATANVDTQTESLIQDAMEKLFRNRTSIVIAHRLSTVRRANRILVLHKGELREEGTHVELLRQGGIYFRLHQLQYKQ